MRGRVVLVSRDNRALNIPSEGGREEEGGGGEGEGREKGGTRNVEHSK